MTDGEVRILAGAARTALVRNTRHFLHFMNPAERREAMRIARAEGCRFSAYGGFEEAERQIGCFFAEGWEPLPEEYPAVCLASGCDSRFSHITHRDILGAYMALGLTRSSLGDIMIKNSRVFLFVESGVSAFVAEYLRMAGKTALCFSPADAACVALSGPEGSYFRAVIGSMRFDAVLAAAFHLSRSSAADLIRGGNGKLDYLVCEKTDATVSPGAMLSLRGRGRVRLASLDGTTRKDRINVTFFRYD